MAASLLNCVPDFTTAFLVRKGAFWLNISTKKDTAKDKNINTFSLKQDFKNLRHSFWAHKSWITMQWKLFQIFFAKRSWSFGNNIQKIPQKPCPKLKKYAFCIFTENICSACNSMQMVFSCKNASILQNIDSNFLTLKLAYYPNNTIKLKHKECLYYKKTSATCKNQLGLITTNICNKVGQNSVNKCKKNAKREAFGYFRTQTYVVSNKFCYQSNSRKSNKVTSITKVRIHDTHNNIKPLLRHNLEKLIYWHPWYCKFQTNKST